MKSLIFVLFFSLSLFANQLIDFDNSIYTIQVYSSKDKNESKDYVKPYLAHGNAFIWPKLVKNDIWYRSCIGLYFSKEEAIAKLELIKKDVPDAFFIIFISK